MKVWLPSDTLTRLARTISAPSTLVGLTTLALITPLASNCWGQFTASDRAPEQGHSILVHEGEPLDAVEPHQSGSTPKPYNAREQIADKSPAQAKGTRILMGDADGSGFVSSNSQPDRSNWRDSESKSLSSSRRGSSTGNLRPSNFSAAQAPAFSARQAAAIPRKEKIDPLPTERRISPRQQVQSDKEVIVDRSVTPASFAAPVQSFQNKSRQPMQSLQPSQNTGQTNRYDSRRNQAAQRTQQRQTNRSPKKTSASAKVLISKFGFKGSQDNSDNLVPLRLADVLNQGQMRANRSQLINQYWETFEDWALSVSAAQHRDWVSGLRVSKSTDQSTVGVAKSSAENDVTSSRIELGKSQAKLKQVLGAGASIVPADLPTVTMVKTNFQAFKERGLIPARLEGIDQTLTDLHDLILSRADTVLLAERTAEQVKGYYQSNQATIEQLLGAGHAWRSAEADFLSSTIEYNKAYTDYALALPYGRAPVEQVVAMLVAPTTVSPTAAAPYAGGNTQQAQMSRTPSQPASSSRSVPQRQKTRPQRGQDSRVRAASNGFGQSTVPKSRTQRPMPDFSESSNDSVAAASFTPRKTPEFRPNSTKSVPATGTRENAKAATSGLGFGSRNATQPAAEPVSKPTARSPVKPSTSAFDIGKKTTDGSSGVSARRSSTGFSSGANSKVKAPTVDPFSSQPSVSQPPSKPSFSFGGGGSGAGSTPAAVTAKDGFDSGFAR